MIEKYAQDQKVPLDLVRVKKTYRYTARNKSEATKISKGEIPEKLDLFLHFLKQSQEFRYDIMSVRWHRGGKVPFITFTVEQDINPTA
jgi:hypothetical protein